MKSISVLFAALASNVPTARADDVAVEVLWQACPYLLGTAASVALKRLTLPPDDIAAIPGKHPGADTAAGRHTLRR